MFPYEQSFMKLQGDEKLQRGETERWRRKAKHGVFLIILLSDTSALHTASVIVITVPAS